MRFSVIGRFILITSLGAGIGALGGCKPNPPPDVLKTYRRTPISAERSTTRLNNFLAACSALHLRNARLE
jgi:hypothetical protein